MSYEMVNEELNIKSCSLADLTMEQVHHFLKIWDDGSAIGTLALFFDKDGTLVLNRDNEHYSDYQEIAEGLLKLDLEQAQNEARYEDAAKLQYATIPHLEKLIREQSDKQKEDALIQETVNEELIAKIVSRWTGVEVSRLVESERQKLLHLKEALQKETQKM